VYDQRLSAEGKERFRLSHARAFPADEDDRRSGYGVVRWKLRTHKKVKRRKSKTKGT